MGRVSPHGVTSRRVPAGAPDGRRLQVMISSFLDLKPSEDKRRVFPYACRSRRGGRPESAAGCRMGSIPSACIPPRVGGRERALPWRLHHQPPPRASVSPARSRASSQPGEGGGGAARPSWPEPPGVTGTVSPRSRCAGGGTDPVAGQPWGTQHGEDGAFAPARGTRAGGAEAPGKSRSLQSLSRAGKAIAATPPSPRAATCMPEYAEGCPLRAFLT